MSPLDPSKPPAPTELRVATMSFGPGRAASARITWNTPADLDIPVHHYKNQVLLDNMRSNRSYSVAVQAVSYWRQTQLKGPKVVLQFTTGRSTSVVPRNPVSDNLDVGTPFYHDGQLRVHVYWQSSKGVHSRSETSVSLRGLLYSCKYKVLWQPVGKKTRLLAESISFLTPSCATIQAKSPKPIICPGEPATSPETLRMKAANLTASFRVHGGNVSATFSWDLSMTQPQQQLIGYQATWVEIVPTKHHDGKTLPRSFISRSQILPPNGRVLVVSGLHPASVYRLDVKAITAEGEGPAASRTFQTPGYQSTPKQRHGTPVSRAFIVLSTVAATIVAVKSTWTSASLLPLLLLEVSVVSLLDSSKPNFVLMMVDDLGIGDLGCYGNKTLRTPNIDRLAREGVTLTHHIAAASLCTPSRAAFLTGRYPIRSGMAGHLKPGVFLFNAASGGLPSRELTFAAVARRQGYETALIGKWHLGLNCKSSDDHCHHPSIHGFNYFFGIPLTNLRDCQPGHGTVFQIHKYLPYRTLGLVLGTAAALHLCRVIPLRRGLILALLSALIAVTTLTAGFIKVIPYFNCVLFSDHQIVEQPFTSENLTQRMTGEALDFIERNSARPFLLFFSFLQVHTAMFASAAFKGSSDHGIYGDAVHEVDWSVGQITQMLERLKLRENTLIYLTSDQGAHLEEASAAGQVHGGWNGIYKAGKSTNWEGGIRVPGIFSWPGRIPGGRQIAEPTSNMDLFPTVVRLSGASLPLDREIDGHDLMDLLQNKVGRSNHEFLFHYCNSYLNAVRWHPRNSSSVWKAFFFTPDFYPEDTTACFHTHVCFCTPDYVTHHNPPLLYDLWRDPSERVALTPDTEPAFHSILAVMREAAETHQRSVKPVESQLTAGKLVWKPWLQPCCSTLSRLCQCRHDHRAAVGATRQ
ncbi:steryl-sulfatase [Xenentodon cancila]